MAYYLDDNIVHTKPLITDDVTYEIIKTSNNDSGGWNSDYSYFVSNLGNWFERGCGTNVGSKAGIFCFSRNSGGKMSNRSFRMILSKE